MGSRSETREERPSITSDAVRLAVLGAIIVVIWGCAYAIGGERPILVGAFVLSLLFCVQYAIDLRNRRNAAIAQEAIRDAHDLAVAHGRAFAQALESVPHGVILVERDWKIALVNDAAIRMLALPPELATPGVDGRDVLRHQIQQGDLADDAMMREVLKSPTVQSFGAGDGQSKQSWPVFERKTRDGRTLEIRTSHIEDGRMIRTYTDVTERINAIEALNAAMRSRTEFLDTVSHELRTPLNAVIGLANLLQTDVVRPQQKADLQAIEDSGRRLLSMVNDIMTTSSLESGGLVLQEKPFDLRGALQRTIQAVTRQAEAKRLSLDVVIDDDLPKTVVGDEERFCTMLLKLLDNALKFTERGGVTLTAKLAGADERFHRISISIADTGVGIAPQDQARLFDPFVQAESSNHRRFAGVGIGLTLVKQLLNAMGGTITVTSEPGVGSVFTVEAPLGRVATEQPAVVDAPAARLRVLVAEDVETNRLVLLQVLRRLGFDPHGVSNGLEAVAEMNAAPYDVVLMDVMMPEMDGIQATKAIRALPDPAGTTPIIAVTARPLESVQAECLEAGVNRVETRPINMARLQKVIEAVLAERPPRSSEAA